MAFQVSPLKPFEPAAELATRMLERADIQREILEETITSARAGSIQESGRTVCGTARNPLLPIEREFSRVTLPTCPVSVGGTWHTHITTDQLLNPVNSLPDFANVAFGIVDVSIVAGAESSHVVVGTENLAPMQQLLAEELGVDVASPGDVAKAVISGDVRDPADVRRRIYSRTGRDVAYRADTAAPDLAAEVESLPISTPAGFAAPAVAMSGCTMYDLYTRPSTVTNRNLDFIDQSRELQDSVRSLVEAPAQADFNFKQQVLATTISVAVGNTVERLLFG